MAKRIIDIAKDFAVAPGPRYAKFGPNSGELLRRSVLVPAISEAIANDYIVVVKLDGVAGYGGSFLEEAFGGLVRLEGFTRDQLASALSIVAETDAYRPYRDMALSYIRQAKPAAVLTA